MADSGAFDSYPVFLDLRSRLAVVVGEGADAERKARSLLKHGADVAVITTDPPLTLLQAESEGLLGVESREFTPGDLVGAFIVFCLHESPEVRDAVVADARANNCLIHVSGAPEMSNFQAPSIMRRGPLQIAISTSGLAPVLARRVRQDLKERYAEEWTDYVRLFGELGRLLARRLPADPSAQRAVLDAVADSDVLERIREGGALDAEALYDEFAAAVDAASTGTDTADTESEGT